MTLKNVKPSLNKITKSLAVTQDSREFLLKNTREIIILCSKSIIAVHKGELTIAKNNLKQAWWKTMVWQRDDVEGLDASILTSPNVLKYSGHEDTFTDPLCDCKDCKSRWREDQLSDKACPSCGSKNLTVGMSGSKNPILKLENIHNDIKLVEKDDKGRINKYCRSLSSY